jgi:prevent-host-death family protein
MGCLAASIGLFLPIPVGEVLMPIVDIDEAAQNLSRLVDAVLSGEHGVIAKSGKPVVRLVPVETLVAVRHFGALKGTVHIGCDFDAPLPGELIAQFEGS